MIKQERVRLSISIAETLTTVHTRNFLTGLRTNIRSLKTVSLSENAVRLVKTFMK